MKANTIEPLQRNIGVNLYNLGFGNGFSDMTLEGRTTKEKTDQASSKLKTNTTGHFERGERQCAEWKMMFIFHISDEDLVSRIY